jgi:hypothetical protein
MRRRTEMKEIRSEEAELVHRALVDNCIVLPMDGDGSCDITTMGKIAALVGMSIRRVDAVVSLLASAGRLEMRERVEDWRGSWVGGWLRAI